MTQNVKLVVMNGKVVEHEFTGYVNPIPEFNSWQQLSRSIDVSPTAIPQGTATTLARKGQGLLAVPPRPLNGRELETKFVNRSELQAALPADAVSDVGMYKVTVKSSGETVAESGAAPLVVKFK